MKKIKNLFSKIFICNIKGHDVIPFLSEDEYVINNKKCKRCNSILGMGRWKFVRDSPPPNADINEWHKFIDIQENNFRLNTLKEQKEHGIR